MKVHFAAFFHFRRNFIMDLLIIQARISWIMIIIQLTRRKRRVAGSWHAVRTCCIFMKYRRIKKKWWSGATPAFILTFSKVSFRPSEWNSVRCHNPFSFMLWKRATQHSAFLVPRADPPVSPFLCTMEWNLFLNCYSSFYLFKKASPSFAAEYWGKSLCSFANPKKGLSILYPQKLKK